MSLPRRSAAHGWSQLRRHPPLRLMRSRRRLHQRWLEEGAPGQLRHARGEVGGARRRGRGTSRRASSLVLFSEVNLAMTIDIYRIPVIERAVA
uniref:Uncharacterized protein n=1 Tax=Arundo donax TaxID=35708 RepID=A0A0A9CU80_ARUDO